MRRLRQHGDEAGAARGVGAIQAAAVTHGDVAGDCKAEPGPAVATIASLVDTREPFEDPLPVGGRNAGNILADLDTYEARLGFRDAHDDAVAPQS